MKIILFIFSLFLISLNQTSAAKDNHVVPPGEGPWIIIAHYENKQDVLELKPDYDLWRIDEASKTVELLVANKTAYNALIERGFVLELHEKLMQQQAMLQSKSVLGVRAIDNFPCYRTVTETFATMASMASNYPSLVTLVDIGNTWHKNEPGGNPGHDMQVVKITNSNQLDPEKPILYAMGSIHSREYPPAELVTRFAEYLLSEYGNDPDVTWLVDYHEIHLLLQGNPDGRVISEGEASSFQRKNYNADHCEGGGGFGDMQGVDMNRNFQFLWNMGTGSSGQECSSSFRGDSAVSEPETEAINEYIKVLFPDDRDDDLVSQSPLDKPGVYLDIHNYAGLTLFPFGYSNTAVQAPNHGELQTLARRMSYFNGYRPEQANASLGGADGASEDNAYGTLGVAAYTFELSSDSGFYTTCPYFENTVWPDNLPALIYAAKAARMPYMLASGPDVINIPTLVIEVDEGDDFNVSGTATDLQFENNNGTEPTQNITAVTAYLATPSWQPGAVGVSLSATDGAFNTKTEDFNGTLDTSGLSEGRYTIWFEATDASGATGVPAAVFLDVLDTGPNDVIFIHGFEL
ncbi:MAG: M14 family zinc carboxypeptidase [Marinicella sp.]